MVGVAAVRRQEGKEEPALTVRRIVASFCTELESWPVSSESSLPLARDRAKEVAKCASINTQIKEGRLPVYISTDLYINIYLFGNQRN